LRLNQNIENNPMQSKKGSLAWMLTRENILTRRANHRHCSSIAQLELMAPQTAAGASKDQEIRQLN
jgi:hypothetical protein